MARRDTRAIAPYARREIPMDARIIATKGTEVREIARWQDHYSLHDWMGELFSARGHDTVEWEARTSLDIEPSELDLLEEMVGAPRRAIGYSLKSTWVNSKHTNETARLADLEVITRCRAAIADGMSLSYVYTW